MDIDWEWGVSVVKASAFETTRQGQVKVGRLERCCNMNVLKDFCFSFSSLLVNAIFLLLEGLQLCLRLADKSSACLILFKFDVSRHFVLPVLCAFISGDV